MLSLLDFYQENHTPTHPHIYSCIELREIKLRTNAEDVLRNRETYNFISHHAQKGALHVYP